MKALCVDDEPLLLKNMEHVLKQIDEITEVICFSSELKAIEWAKNNKADIAFLDIELRQMTGLGLAEKLKEIWPDVVCVFCTAYSSYAVDAIEMELTDGYLLKPISAEDVRGKIDRLKERGRLGKKLLTVQLTGSVAAFDKEGNQIHFKRSKTEQLFWFLIHQDGETVSSDEICEALWEDDGFMHEQNKKYLWSAISFLRQILEKAGALDVLVRWNGGYKMEMSLIEVRK